MSDDDDLGTAEWLMAKGGQLVAETEEARQESFSAQMSRLLDTYGKAGNVLAALFLNLVAAGVGMVIYWGTSGVLAYFGAGLAIVSLLAIVRWVLGL